MAFKRIMLMDVYEIIRRWHGKQKISHISNVTGYDRKTVRRYIGQRNCFISFKGYCQRQNIPPAGTGNS
jgi:hypothetical protein